MGSGGGGAAGSTAGTAGGGSSGGAPVAGTGGAPSPAAVAARRGHGGAQGGAAGTATGGTAGSTCTTSVSGTVFDPAGTTPLYNVIVYSPAVEPGPVPEGTACVPCTQLLGQPIAAALTDTRGHFRLQGIPSGANVPLVIQVGKWRRQITVPSVVACMDTLLADPNLTRLPRHSGEGHLPKLAVATGSAGAPECWLRKLGIADSEFSPETGWGAVHLFAGGAGMNPRSGTNRLASGATFTDAYAALYANSAKLASYDMLLLGCEGSRLEDEKSPHTANLRRYADNGGRIWAEHLHSIGFDSDRPPGQQPRPGSPSESDLPTPGNRDGRSQHAEGSSPIGLADGHRRRDERSALDHGGTAFDQRRRTAYPGVALYHRVCVPTNSPAIPQLFTFSTPVEAAAAAQCGRVDFVDMHSGADGDSSTPEQPFPDGCTTTALSAQSRLMEFVFFDTPTCVH